MVAGTIPPSAGLSSSSGLRKEDDNNVYDDDDGGGDHNVYEDDGDNDHHFVAFLFSPGGDCSTCISLGHQQVRHRHQIDQEIKQL